MRKFVVRRTGCPPLRFIGKLLVYRDTSPNSAHPNYSGSPGRWSETKVYILADNRFVLARANYTQWQGERNKFYASIFNNLCELIAHLEEISPITASIIAKQLDISQSA